MRSSAGEHLVHTEGVTGSIPVASTISFNALADHTGRETRNPTRNSRVLGIESFVCPGDLV
jgi:hypothetical protein